MKTRYQVFAAVLLMTAAPVFAWAAAPATNPAPATTAAGTAKPETSHHMLSRKHIEAIQAALDNNGEKVDVDGRWGPKTVAAVKDFQQHHGLPASGRADKTTIAQLHPANW
jgi:peptidoglycan hydrolase-like protein with peptidoglycan-binding domain